MQHKWGTSKKQIRTNITRKTMGTKAGTHEGRVRRGAAKTKDADQPPVHLTHTSNIALRAARADVFFTSS